MYIKTFENYKKNENDQSDQIQYQFRDIDEGMYLKRKKGDTTWEITTKEDFEENGNDTFHSVIKYDQDFNKIVDY